MSPSDAVAETVTLHGIYPSITMAPQLKKYCIELQN